MHPKGKFNVVNYVQITSNKRYSVFQRRQRSRAVLPECFRPRGLSCSGLKSAFTFNLTSLAIDMAIAGGGVLLGQKRLIAQEIRNGDLVIVDGFSLPLSKAYFVAWPQRSVNHPGRAALLAWLEGLAESELRQESA